METKELGNWGKMIEVNETSHITQTNENAVVGKGFHVSTCIPGTPIKVRDFFDDGGDFIETSFGWNK